MLLQLAQLHLLLPDLLLIVLSAVDCCKVAALHDDVPIQVQIISVVYPPNMCKLSFFVKVWNLKCLVLFITLGKIKMALGYV